MDKGILIEYADMKEEIKDLRQRIEKIQKELDKLHGQIVVDSVSCGKKGSSVVLVKVKLTLADLFWLVEVMVSFLPLISVSTLPTLACTGAT